MVLRVEDRGGVLRIRPQQGVRRVRVLGLNRQGRCLVQTLGLGDEALEDHKPESDLTTWENRRAASRILSRAAPAAATPDAASWMPDPRSTATAPLDDIDSPKRRLVRTVSAVV